MARLYFLSGTNSDLSGGADFSRALFYNNMSASTTLAVSIAAASTEISYGFTPALHPGVRGATGNYTVTIDVTSGNASISGSITLHRINSSGTVQSSSTTTATQTLNPIGVKTFTFTSLNLGTWADGDRLRVDYRFTNSNNMSVSSVVIGINDVDAYVSTPFIVRSFVTT